MTYAHRCPPTVLRAMLSMAFVCLVGASVAMADQAANVSTTAMTPVPKVDHARIAEKDIPHFSYSPEQTDVSGGGFAGVLLPAPRTSTFLVVMLAVFTVLGSRSFLNAKRRDG